MTEITLVRHGQASFGTDDYDRLSPLGHQQAQWLGEYYTSRELYFDRIIIGGQLRHRQTAEGILTAFHCDAELEVHEGFNEYNFEALYHSFCQQYPEQAHSDFDDRRHFYAVLRKALQAWSQDELTGPLPETWQHFHQRIEAAMEFAASIAKKKVLVISSGGAISMIMKQTLNVDPDTMISLNLQMINTAYSQLLKTRSRTQLLSFNNTPHLDNTDRIDTVTYS